MSSGGTNAPEAVSRIKEGKGDFAKVGEVKGFKVLKYKDSTNAKVPLFAGDSQVYLVVNGNNEIKHITFYKNHEITRSIDLDGGTLGIHAHNWKAVDGQPRRTKPKHDVLSGTEWALTLMILNEVERGGLFKLGKGVDRQNRKFLRSPG